jgi:hypothetical protein
MSLSHLDGEFGVEVVGIGTDIETVDDLTFEESLHCGGGHPLRLTRCCGKKVMVTEP